MQFKQTKNKKSSKEWNDCDGLGYRITWRSKFAGVTVTPGYYACIQVVRFSDGMYWWDFAWLRRQFRTYKRATEACVKHKRLWDQFIKLSHAKGRRTEKLKELDTRGRVKGANMLGSLPVWVLDKAETSLIRIHFKHDEPTRKSN